MVSDSEFSEILKISKTIVVIGCSANQEKAAYRIPKYMQNEGYTIIPINPKADEILGEKVYRSIDDVVEPIDIVDIFRPGPECDAFVEAALKKNPKLIFLQLRISNVRAKQLAYDAKTPYIENKCLMVEHKRLLK